MSAFRRACSHLCLRSSGLGYFLWFLPGPLPTGLADCGDGKVDRAVCECVCVHASCMRVCSYCVYVGTRIVCLCVSLYPYALCVCVFVCVSMRIVCVSVYVGVQVLCMCISLSSCVCCTAGDGGGG